MSTHRDSEAETIAAEVLAAQTAGRQIAPLSDRMPGLDLRRAYAIAATLRRLREAQGEKVVGRKIGFTNRSMWEPYNVHAPIWGYMYASTLHDLAAIDAFDLAHLCEAQIEPEIVFKLAAAPRGDMDEQALLGCIEWCAHGFEVVALQFPGWRFTAADGVAAGGLHGALLIGTPRPVDAGTRAEWVRQLGAFRLELLRGDDVVDRGTGANVLDHPLTALRHLVALLAQDPDNPPLAAGEIVTTGSITRACRIAPGERWTTRVEDLPLSGIAISFR